MTTEQKFNCIFCKDVFDNKEELQVHFRKHADPQFKSKNRFGNDPQVDDEKANEKSEMVSCDVCSQMFPTISKAITHKHKVHPDHDVKYFCPWCGKLFTMKHPYNIHIQSSHDKKEQIESKIFHCDCCDVDFFLPSAMLYHNKFFHRQDSEIPDVGISKKLKLYNQEVLQLHYCAFCGEEYENKVNLFKHITDDHSDENQSPDEVLRCPLCEAIFYHLDAYEIHLSFHTTEDLYSVQNELFADLLDFSLETVPPIIEKVENRGDFEDEAHSQDTDTESNMNSVGIEKFLELAMDQPEDSNPGKVKKKKHKKSKKHAITLDEFLSMNQDVFGEDLDFQGVEELPTRVVKRRVKNNKKSVNPVTSAELEKLKQKGIVVVKVGASKSTKAAQKKLAKKTAPNRELKTSSEVLTKLMNQSNNQIKIVKKSVPSITKNDAGQDVKMTSTEDKSDHNENETKNKCEEAKKEKNILETEIRCTQPYTSPLTCSKDIHSSNTKNPSSFTSTSTVTGTSNNKSTELSHAENDIKSISVEASNLTANNTVNVDNNRIDNLQKLGESNDELKSLNTTINKDLNQHYSDYEESDSEMFDRNNETDIEGIEESTKCIDEIQNSSNNSRAEPHIRPPMTSLTTLKHLSHLTVKPVNQVNTASEFAKEVSDSIISDKSHVKIDKEQTRLNFHTDNDVAVVKPTIDKDPLDALKSLSKNITIKSLAVSANRSLESGSEADEEADETIIKTKNSIQLKNVSGNKNITLKKMKIEPNEPEADEEADETIIKTKNSMQLGGNKNVTIKKIKIETNEPSLTNKVINMVNNPTTNIQALRPTNKVSTSSLDVQLKKNIEDPTKNTPLKTNISTHLTNKTITIPSNKHVQSQVIKQNKSTIKNHKVQEIIEISDIDDSDNETDYCVGNERKQDTTTSLDSLKNLSKHITVKSVNQPVQSVLKHIKLEKTEEQTDDEELGSHVFKCDADMPSNAKVCGQKLSSKNVALKNALKNLGKNITVKSGNSSPCQIIKSQDPYSQDSNIDDVNEPDEDLDSNIEKVKITELEDGNIFNHEDFDNCDGENSDNQPVVESPNDSGSEHDEPDPNLLDFESEINASAVMKTNQEVTINKNTICLNNLKNISKNLTIKSLNVNSTDKQDTPKSTLPQENIESAKKQTRQPMIKPTKHLVKESSNDSSSTSRNQKNVTSLVDHASNESLNRKVSVNKEVTVKTFQTKTVIQEITTTVTKTIKTVNQTVKQETRNSGQMNTPVIPQKVQGIRPGPSKNLQGVVIRQAGPAAIRPNNIVTQVRPANTVVRPSKQVVLMRGGSNLTRPSTPRMPTSKSNDSKSSPNKQEIGKPLKFSASAMASTIAKRSNPDEVTGPFSCFKKPKESLIPVSDIPAFASGDDTMFQVKAASQTTSSYVSTSKVVKGNSIVTATQVKSEVSSMQQLSRLSNSGGLKVKSAQVKQSQVQESETNLKKRTTLEAIERLQKQGLLVKKPRIEVNENSDFDHPDDNEGMGYSSADEQDE